MRVLVCGGRDYQDKDAFDYALTKLNYYGDVTEICHGGAKGADALAGVWAAQWNIPCKVYKADWTKHGKSAGPIRNQFMLDDFKPNVVIAFPGGSGTADMVRRARKAGVTVHIQER